MDARLQCEYVCHERCSEHSTRMTECLERVSAVISSDAGRTNAAKRQALHLIRTFMNYE